MSLSEPVLGPFAHSGASITRTMVLVMVALLPTTLFGFHLFGWPALFLFVTTVLAAIVAEALALRIAGKPVRVFLGDGSAVVTGWIIALTLPPWAPWWIGVLGAFVAIFLAKHAFGGIGQNLFNPAMIARTVLLISFPVEMTRFLMPAPLLSPGAPDFLQSLAITFGKPSGFDAISSASLLGFVKTELAQGLMLRDILADSYDPLAMTIGTVAGSTGETSAALIVLGGLFLLVTRTITWHAPAAMIVTMAALSGTFHLIDPDRFLDPVVHLLSGTFLFGTFFIATDYVTAPATGIGKLIFGAGVAALTFIIRTWAAYPEGVAFAILLMNATVPLIDYAIRPRIYGRNRKGAPLRIEPVRRTG